MGLCRVRGVPVISVCFRFWLWHTKMEANGSSSKAQPPKHRAPKQTVSSLCLNLQLFHTPKQLELHFKQSHVFMDTLLGSVVMCGFPQFREFNWVVPQEAEPQRKQLLQNKIHKGEGLHQKRFAPNTIFPAPGCWRPGAQKTETSVPSVIQEVRRVKQRRLRRL